MTSKKQLDSIINKAIEDIFEDYSLYRLPSHVTRVRGEVYKENDMVMFFNGQRVSPKELKRTLSKMLKVLLPKQTKLKKTK